MKINYKNKTYNLRWPKEFDQIILGAAEKHLQRNGTIDWIGAEAAGSLKGLPINANLKTISHRNCFLKRRETKKYIDSRKERAKTGKKFKSIYNKDRLSLFDDIKDSVKKGNGWRPKSVWTKTQKEILISLTTIHRKSKLSVDWVNVALDKRATELPYQDTSKLMKYYGQYLSLQQKKTVYKKRKNAIEYKKTHHAEFLKSQLRNYYVKKNSINEFLLSKILLRT